VVLMDVGNRQGQEPGNHHMAAEGGREGEVMQ
jgi:hypothetical protein